MTTAMATTAAPLFTLPSADPAPERRGPFRDSARVAVASEAAPVRHPVAPAAEPRPARVHRLAHGRLTLDELVSGAWAAIGAGAPAACPVCDGALRARAGGAVEAQCARCGSELA
ncbi:MAG: hypothetical protein QOE65_362 [Solirubrobacteraceae bacterium]|jgi:hypothetical protein|nr:hypothetical protein [Solirubrobacteraceae bacterium]